MEPDSYQKAWQSQSSQARVTIAADLLLKEVQRSQRSFRATIFHRDFREVAIGLLMIPFWFFLGYRLIFLWPWYLEVPPITGGFLLSRWIESVTSSSRVSRANRCSIA